jgi:hypothetical protein
MRWLILLAVLLSACTQAESNPKATEPPHVNRTELAAILETTAAGPTAGPIATPEPPPYALALISAECNRTLETFITCEGFVRNVSNRSIEDVVAVANFHREDGTPITSDEALIDYNPILPGQDSPFSIIATYNPAIAKWEIDFKELFGGTILTRDDR